ncbi:MAG: hypothetical protein O3A10_11420 [Chloroflexi bacterium]|nr:hypothetical protein [Chloroflexota bacterium]MDA1147127.1 hypothetical protein [Chloroflexota bacterium]
MASGSRRRRLAGCTIALATFGVLLIGGCTSDDDPDPSPTPTTVDAAASSTATATTESTAEPTPAVLLPHEDLLPRWVTYGIPSWQLTDAVLTNQDPGR